MTKEENRLSSHPQKKTRENTCYGGPGPLSSPSPSNLTPSHSSPGGFLLALMHPTLVLVYLKNVRTASVAFSFQSHLTEGALGCFHPHAFPMSFYSLVIWGRQALRSVKGGGRSVAFLPRTTNAGHHPSCGSCLSDRA